MEVESKEWIMAKYVDEGVPTSEHLKMRSVKVKTDIESIPPDHVLLRLLWLSVDPYLRGRMSNHQEGLYASAFSLNEPLTAFGIGEVIQSKHSNFCVGDIAVCPFSPIAEYSYAPAIALRKIDTSTGVSALHYLSALGVPGFAAWLGIVVLGDPKPGDNVFISAAAGGVGVIAGQLAKLKGCRVVGSVGTDLKVQFLKKEIGYHDVFNYNKEIDFDVALSKYFPNGIDIYLDNVGGKMLEAVLNHVNKQARIPLCGMISQYNKVWTERDGIRNLLNVVGKGVRMEGFMLGFYLDRFGEFMDEMIGYIKQGKMLSEHKIYYGIESFQESMESLFTSSNIGKVILQVNKDVKA